MSIKYDSKREPLAEIVKKATDNATYVIPDLQRPYVWELWSEVGDSVRG